MTFYIDTWFSTLLESQRTLKRYDEQSFTGRVEDLEVFAKMVSLEVTART